ncbi:NUDIX hydrolase [Nocardioides euryhalodurans]|uniref:NUDIX domain-containing protein n=1 Tax=Nocardioides euryhalodurans TaxID=2518370 RepID=A0A4P7GJV3_9ACTN|nr:NUDIX domain-containing protein [Nocardioides euryhalodurans]QBR92300.1 NUDIX domain-containing protein [Nocardioides euryhalodurans]
MTDRFTVVPASYVYLVREGAAGPEVLLQLRRNTGYMDDHWAAAAAGHVERGETAYDAARREAAEELGIAGLDLAFELTMHRTAHDQPIDERVDFFFTARAWTGEPRIVEPEKCAELRWCPVDVLPSPMVPHEAFAIASLGQGTAYVSYGFDKHDSVEGAP